MGAVPASASSVPFPSPHPTRRVLAPPPLDGEEKIFLLILFTAIAIVTGVAFILLGVVANTYYSAPVTSNLAAGSVTFFGAGILAYTFGLRHGVDADHIAAIDNTTRKLQAEGKRPLTIGTFFSLGHSTIVFALAIAIGFATRAVSSAVTNSHSSLQTFGSFFGTLVSGGFLYLIAGLNLVVLIGIVQIFLEMRRGKYNDLELEAQLNSRGFMFRFLGPLARAITKPWQMYPVGLLFGLGFDTASEVALLVVAGTATSAGLPLYAIISLPLLFAAGMSMMDSFDGAFMNYAYGWAFSKPLRKVYYNIAITGISVAVALIIGTIELVQVLQSELHLRGGIWNFAAGFSINSAGFLIVGLFVVTWVAALLIWRYGNVEERWERAAAEARARSGRG